MGSIIISYHFLFTSSKEEEQEPEGRNPDALSVRQTGITEC